MAANYEMNKLTKKGWTKQPNAIFRDKDLTSDAYKVISFLLSITGDYHISESGIASTVNISLDRVKKAVKLLKSTGYIEVSKVTYNNRLNGYVWKISDTNGTYRKCNFREMENPATENPATENPATENPATENPTDGISSDRETQRPKTRLTENPSIYEYTEGYEEINNERRIDEQTELDEERENEKDLSLNSSFQSVIDSLGKSSSEAKASPLSNKNTGSGEKVITQTDLTVNQAFDKFCDVYPNLADRNAAREAFVAIPDVSNICWQIVQSVEWFKKTNRWDNWQTGQKNVSCPKAVKFLRRGDWQEYLKSDDKGENAYANSDAYKVAAKLWHQIEIQNHISDDKGE